MNERHLTFMIIPHEEGRVRAFNVSRRRLWEIFCLVLLSLCALAYFGISYHVRFSPSGALSLLEGENSALKTELGQFRSKLLTLEMEVDALSETDRVLRAWTSLSRPGDKDGRSPRGDLVPIQVERRSSGTYNSLDHLLREARFLSSSLDSIASALRSREKLQAHIPSIFPVLGEEWYSAPFGYHPDPFTGRRRLNKGINIVGREGTDVVTTADGTVENVGWEKRLGYYIKIDHQIGLQTVYGHLQGKPDLKPGTAVKRGQVIGKLGKSGRTTAPSLHYIVVRDRRAVDPAKFIFLSENPPPSVSAQDIHGAFP